MACLLYIKLSLPVGLAVGTRRNVSSNGWKRIWHVKIRSPENETILTSLKAVMVVLDMDTDPYDP